ncbi:hypothetical protein KCU87_g377, partial [Aureobasidium melanogenum]
MLRLDRFQDFCIIVVFLCYLIYVYLHHNTSQSSVRHEVKGGGRGKGLWSYSAKAKGVGYKHHHPPRLTRDCVFSLLIESSSSPPVLVGEGVALLTTKDTVVCSGTMSSLITTAVTLTSAEGGEGGGIAAESTATLSVFYAENIIAKLQVVQIAAEILTVPEVIAAEL